MAIYTLGFIPLNIFSATNGVKPNSQNGLTVNGGNYDAQPPGGTTISFEYEEIGRLKVESEYPVFTDDPWNPEWSGNKWDQHKQFNPEPIEIKEKTYQPGHIQLENEYEVVLQGDDGKEYTLVAISARQVNPDGDNWEYIDYSGELGIIGFTFEGDWPPEGTELTFVENKDGETIPWQNFVDEEEVPCFAHGTLVLTERGEVAVEDLRLGDLVLTRDNGPQPIRWIGSRRMGRATLNAAPNLRPIRIRAGALGAGVPAADLVVSPQHRVLVRSHIAQRMFGTAEVLVAAKQLLQLDGIDIADDLAEVEYFHILFDRHEVVLSNGAETESLYTGPMALKSVGRQAREEIFAIFPELRETTSEPPSARPLASGRQARKLAIRHMQNGKDLVSEMQSLRMN